MRSPFPGMDPYLEDPGGWGGVHDALIALLRERLNRDLGPGYIADGDTRVYVLSPDEQRWVFPDVSIIETPAPVSYSRNASHATGRSTYPYNRALREGSRR